MDVSEQPPGTNKRIGRYELLKQVDRGFLGPLWAARFDHQGTSLAAFVRIVEPPPNVSADLWEALSDAAWTAIDLQVPGVVHCADVVFQANTLALVDDYVEGQPLSSLLRTKGNGDPAFPIGIALCIARDTLNALDELASGSTSLGVESSHGGVSPDALLIGTDGMTRVLNPLVSAAATSEEYFRTLPERAAYVAPEQWLQKTIDERTDVYAVGCILWELLTRKRLHAGSAANIRRCATSDRLPAPLTDARAEGVPSAVLQALHKALAPEPAARFETLRAFAKALEACAIQLASAPEVAHFVENMASARLEEQRTATENSTIAHLTDFFKAERPASVHPPAEDGKASGNEQPKLKLGLALQAKANPKPVATVAPKAAVPKAVANTVANTVAPNAAVAATPPSSHVAVSGSQHASTSLQVGGPATMGQALSSSAAASSKSVVPLANARLKSMAPAPVALTSAVAPTVSPSAVAVAVSAPATGVLKHVVVPVLAANDASEEPRPPGGAVRNTKTSKANTTLLGISPPQILAAATEPQARALAARLDKEPARLDTVASIAQPPVAAEVAVAAAPDVLYDDESLTIPYDDLLTVSRMIAGNANRVPVLGPKDAAAPHELASNTSLVPTVTTRQVTVLAHPAPTLDAAALDAATLDAATLDAAALDAAARGAATRGAATRGAVARDPGSPSPVSTSTVPAASEPSTQTVSLIDLRVTPVGSYAPAVPSMPLPASDVVAVKRQNWPAVTWFFMGCTVSLGIVVLSGAFRSPVPMPAQALQGVSAPAAPLVGPVVAAGNAGASSALPEGVNAMRAETIPVVAALSAVAAASASPGASVPIAGQPGPAGAGSAAVSPNAAAAPALPTPLPAAAAAPAASGAAVAAPPPVAPTARKRAARAPAARVATPPQVTPVGALPPGSGTASRPRGSAAPAPAPAARSSGRSKYVPKDL